MAGKGSRQRPTDRSKFESNWDKIFGSKNGESKEEGLRESYGLEYQESDNPLEGGLPNYEEGSLRDAEHLVQHDSPKQDN